MLLEAEGGSGGLSASKVGINFFRKFYELEKKVYRVEYWDLPGARRYIKMTARYAAGSAAIMIVFDRNNRSTFNHVKEWMESIDRSAAPILVLVSNATSMNRTKRSVPHSEAQRFAERNKME